MRSGKIIVLVCVLLVLFLSPSLSKAVCEAGKEDIFLAENSSDFESKLQHYTGALDKCSNDIEILTAIVDLYIDYEYYDAAYGVTYRIISLNKFNADGYYKLAYIYMMWEEYDQAEETAQKALNINSYFVDTYLLLGDIKYYTREYKDAMNYYRKALDLDSSNTDAFLKIAGLFFLFEKYDKVIAYLDKALLVEKIDEVVMLKELIQKNIKNDYKGVKLTADEILRRNPNNLMALETLGMAMLENEPEKSNCLEVLTKVYYLEKQPFLKGKVEREIEKILNSVATSTTNTTIK